MSATKIDPDGKFYLVILEVGETKFYTVTDETNLQTALFVARNMIDSGYIKEVHVNQTGRLYMKFKADIFTDARWVI